MTYSTMLNTLPPIQTGIAPQSVTRSVHFGWETSSTVKLDSFWRPKKKPIEERFGYWLLDCWEGFKKAIKGFVFIPITILATLGLAITVSLLDRLLLGAPGTQQVQPAPAPHPVQPVPVSPKTYQQLGVIGTAQGNPFEFATARMKANHAVILKRGKQYFIQPIGNNKAWVLQHGTKSWTSIHPLLPVEIFPTGNRNNPTDGSVILIGGEHFRFQRQGKQLVLYSPALDQSIGYGRTHSLWEPLKPGFRQSAYVSVGTDILDPKTGKKTDPTDSSEITVVLDPSFDPALAGVIQAILDKFNQNPGWNELQKMEYIAGKAKTLLSRKSPNATEQQLQSEINQLAQSLPGGEIRMGRLIQEGVGVSSHVSLLTKILANSAGLHVSLEAGFIKTPKRSTGYSWNTWQVTENIHLANGKTLKKGTRLMVDPASRLILPLDHPDVQCYRVFDGQGNKKPYYPPAQVNAFTKLPWVEWHPQKVVWAGP